MHKQSVGQDDIVAILMRNEVKYLEIIQGRRYSGYYFVPVKWHFVAIKIEHIAKDSGAKILVAHADLIHPFDEYHIREVLFAVFPTPTEMAESCYIAVKIRSKSADMALNITLSLQTAQSQPRGTFALTYGSTGRSKGIKRKADESSIDK